MSIGRPLVLALCGLSCGMPVTRYEMIVTSPGLRLYVPEGYPVSKLEVEALLHHWTKEFQGPAGCYPNHTVGSVWPDVNVLVLPTNGDGIVAGYQGYTVNGHVEIGWTPHIWTGALSHELVHVVGYRCNHREWWGNDHTNWPQAFTDQVDAETQADMEHQ